MKLNHKNTFWSSFLVFIIGSSCCWVSSLVVWAGGIALVGSISSFVENIQQFMLVLAGMLFIIGLYLYWKKREKSS